MIPEGYREGAVKLSVREEGDWVVFRMVTNDAKEETVGEVARVWRACLENDEHGHKFWDGLKAVMTDWFRSEMDAIVGGKTIVEIRKPLPKPQGTA
jgi:hypothetical protein